MLETPLFGKYQKEGRRLVFGPPAAYMTLIKIVGAFGVIMAVYGLYSTALGDPTPVYPMWWTLIGALLLGASGLAAASLQSITFDLRERMYIRRQGPGFLPRVSRGPMSLLDALVVISEPNSRMMNGGVTYHLVLHWKAAQEPLMVLQQDTRQLPTGQPLNVGAANLLAQGSGYAKAMGVSFYDNTQFASKCPVPIWAS
jgi:hypothetical protein